MEDRVEALTLELRKRLQQRPADQLATADQRTIVIVGELEDQRGSAQDADPGRSLGKEFAEAQRARMSISARMELLRGAR